MSYLLGWFGFFQITFLPGFLSLKLFKIKTKSILEKLIFIFGLSLIINFVFVFILTLFRLYLPMTIYIIFTLEIIIFLLTIVSRKIDFKFTLPSKQPIFFYLVLFISFCIFIRFFVPFLQNLSLKSVFLQGDAIDSWNLWANQWSQNQIPGNTLIAYPQLIPTNWSLTYVFMQTTTIELFAKLMMPLFTLAILFIFFDLGNFIGLIITGILFHYYFDNSFLRDGYIDIAFSFFSFLPFYCLLLYKKCKQKQYLFLTLIFAIASFLTKQLGIYIVGLSFFYFLIDERKYFLQMAWVTHRVKPSKKIVFAILVLIFITFYWYFLKIPEISLTFNPEAIYHTAMANKISSFSIASRLRQSFLLLAPNIKGVFIITIISLLLLSFSLKNKTSRLLLTLIVFPFFILWSLFLNYDQRGLAVIFPYLGYASTAGINQIINSNESIHWNLRKVQFPITQLGILTLFFMVVWVLSNFFPNQLLINKQAEGKKQIGIPELNSRLYEYYYKNGFSGKISTSYYRLCNLPEIGKYCLYQPDKIMSGRYYLYPQENISSFKNKKVIFKEKNWLFFEK